MQADSFFGGQNPAFHRVHVWTTYLGWAGCGSN